VSAKISKNGVLVVAAAVLCSGARLVSAAGESEGECRRAFNRALAARHRTERSVSRSRVALLRVTSELRRAGLLSVAPEPAPAATAAAAPPVFDASNSELLPALVRATWLRKQEAQSIAARAIAEMDKRRLRQYPVSFRGPEIDPDAENVIPEGLNSCTAWAVHGEQGAFRAEQAAQLAEVAADQSIALADATVATAVGRTTAGR
jgi:hypothetical protein